MPASRKPRRTTAQKLANPAWRATLPDSALNPAQRATRVRNRALKADPLAPVTTLRDLEGQAGTLVDTQQAGDTAAIKADQDRADAEFRTRGGMYRGLANFQSAGAQNAFKNVTDSVNSVITANNAGTAADTANLSAALRAADDAQRAAYAGMGVAPAQPNGSIPGEVPQDVTAERLAALAGTQAGVAQQVGQSGVAQVAGEAAQGAIPGQGLAINLANLTGEKNQTDQEIGTRRRTLGDQRKGLLRQAVRDLQDFEVAKRTYGDQHANMLFQQYIAQKEFDEKVKQESFAEWLQTGQLTGVTAPGGPVAAGQTTLGGRAQDTADRATGAEVTGVDPVTGQPTVASRTLDHQIAVDWANVHINQTQANTAYQQALNDGRTAKTKEAKDRAAERAARIAKGITALDSFLAPVSGEGAPPAATSRYPVGTSSAVTDDKGNPVTHTASQAEADAYNKANPSKPQMIAGTDKIPTTGKPYIRRFDAALAHLKSQGLSQSDALRVLAMSTYTDWNRKAKHLLSRSKRRGRSGHVVQPPKGDAQGGYP